MQDKAINIKQHSVDIDSRCPQQISPKNGSCYEEGDLRNTWIKKIITQFGRSSGLTNLLCIYIKQLEEVKKASCDWCLDITTATGACLCSLGRLSGFSCIQCGVVSNAIQSNQTVTDCDGLDVNLNTYSEQGFPSDIEFDAVNDINEYKSFLSSWQLKRRSRGTGDQLIQAAQKLFPNDAVEIINQGGASIFLGIGRSFTAEELKLIRLYKRVLPTPRGVSLILSERI